MMRVALYSSKRPRCGIATYTSYLEEALKAIGVETRHWGSGVPVSQVFSEIRAWRPEIFHVQHEHSIMPQPDTLRRFTVERTGQGLRNVITLHTEDQAAASLASNFNAVICHRQPKFLRQAHIPQMPCPVSDITPAQRPQLRQRYGFSADAFVVTTAGFMLPWKMTVEIAEILAPWMKENPRVILQLIASEHFSHDSAAYMRRCAEKLIAISSPVDGRIRHVSHYPSDRELLERLTLSDLGYVYCPFDTGSASAAASLFVSARCPLVASSSTHYDHLARHSVRAPKDDVKAFARRIMEVAQDRELLARLRKSNEFFYAETNYYEFARGHVEIYGSVLGVNVKLPAKERAR